MRRGLSVIGYYFALCTFARCEVQTNGQRSRQVARLLNNCAQSSRKSAQVKLTQSSNPEEWYIIAFGKSSDLDSVVAEAANLYRELVQSEQRTVVTYWQFGRLLERLRPQYVGDWMDFLKGQGWSYSRVKRAVRISDRYPRIEDCQDLTLMEALDYKESPESPSAKKSRKSVLPPKTTAEEECPQADADESQAPSPPVEPEGPATTALALYREEDGDGDAKSQEGKEVAKAIDPWAVYREIQAELSRFTGDEIRKARDFMMSFDYPPRAYDVLGYVMADVVVQGTIRKLQGQLPEVFTVI